MPELPEVETMVRGVRPHLEGRRILSVHRCRCACKPIFIQPSLRTICRRTAGTTVTRVRRVAKRVLLDVSSGESFVIEPRMTGLMLLGQPPDRTHLRLQWRFDGNGQYNSLWFWDRRGLGTVRLFTAEQLAVELGSQKLGPDALEMTEDQWYRRCAKTSRAIKVALLDQKLAGGIGNLYASEILHQARIHPAHPANELGPQQVRRLAESVREVLTEAIRCEGSTLGDGTYRNALNQDGNYQNMHRVYGRADEICPTCRKRRVRRIVQAQRSTFYCPSCQKRRG